MSSDSDGHPPRLTSASSEGDADVGVDVVEADDTSSSSSAPIWPLHLSQPRVRRFFWVALHVLRVRKRWRRVLFEAWAVALHVLRVRKLHVLRVLFEAWVGAMFWQLR